MKIWFDKSVYFFLIMLLMVLLTGCGSASGGSSPGSSPAVKATASAGSEVSTSRDKSTGSGTRATLDSFLEPEAPGVTVYGDDTAGIDASNISEGYITIFYNGTSEKPKAQITSPSGNQYIYDLVTGENNVFPVSEGNGTYSIIIAEQIEDSKYAVILSEDIDVTLADEFRPFLYPNQYVQFEKGDAVTELGMDLSDESADDLDYITNVYHYVTENISYDQEMAENVQSGYIPDLEELLQTKKGICFDYACLMAALLRSQGIPTKLVFGYSGTAYHAWISVWLEETGWVDNIISFDGKNWSLMDPTLGANNKSDFVEEYIGDGSHYTAKYWY